MFGRKGPNQVVKQYQYRYTMNRDMERMRKKGYEVRALTTHKAVMGGKFAVLYTRVA